MMFARTGEISPVLANIYLHYVLDLWLERHVRRKCRGQMVYLRYADDFVIGFEREEDAGVFCTTAAERLDKFGLTLGGGQKRDHPLRPTGGRDNRRFAFPGFDFYWRRTRDGKPWLEQSSPMYTLAIGSLWRRV